MRFIGIQLFNLFPDFIFQFFVLPGRFFFHILFPVLPAEKNMSVKIHYQKKKRKYCRLNSADIDTKKLLKGYLSVLSPQEYHRSNINKCRAQEIPPHLCNWLR
jgi:hypothetical protein